MPAAAVAAVLCKNRLRLSVIAVALLTLALTRPRYYLAPPILVQFPVAARLDRRRQPDQGRLVEVAADQHQADRQTIDPATWHGEGGMPRDVERTGVGLHVKGNIDHGAERRIGRRYRGRRERNGR